MLTKNASLKTLLVFSLAGALMTGLLPAQPPQTRPGPGRIQPPNNAGQYQGVVNKNWPRLRQPGPQSQSRERKLTSKALPTMRIDPNVAPPSSNWYLGVFPERAPRGVRLANIAPGSPASRFGLEEGDYILDVSGYVVGEYNGKFYPLTMAMDYGAGPNGWAELLVWNRRTFAEETLWVQFRNRSAPVQLNR